jgi:hypothetical protein
MKQFAIVSIAMFVTVSSWATMACGQYYTTYYYPTTTYYQPATVYYPPAQTAYYASSPTTVYYGAAPTTTYYASSPTTVYYGAAPGTTYYASPPTTVYYGSPPAVTTYYRPLVGGITRVRYSTPAVAYPVVNTYQSYYPWW